MSCEEHAEGLSALLDGELAPARAAALTRHIATCPGCAAHLTELAGLRQALAAELPEEEVPPEFRALISDLLDAETTRQRGKILPFTPRRAAPWLAAAAIAAMLAVSFTPRHGPDRDLMSVRDAMLRTSLAPGVAANITAPAVAGFRLAAARADFVAGHPAQVLGYEAAGRLVTLCIWPAGNEARHGVRSAGYKGTSIEYWNNGTQEYWAATNAPRSTLDAFVQALKEG